MTGRRTTTFSLLSLAVAAGLAAAACGAGAAGTSSQTSAASDVRSATVGADNSSLGRILVDAQGRTLYLFKADSSSLSACDGACAAAWPPLLAHGHLRVAGGLNAAWVSTIQRPGGGRQLTYHGHPLYRFVEDRKPGEVNGEGVTAFGAPWYVLSPAGNRVPPPSSARGVGVSSPGGLGY